MTAPPFTIESGEVPAPPEALRQPLPGKERTAVPAGAYRRCPHGPYETGRGDAAGNPSGRRKGADRLTSLDRQKMSCQTEDLLASLDRRKMSCQTEDLLASLDRRKMSCQTADCLTSLDRQKMNRQTADCLASLDRQKMDHQTAAHWKKNCQTAARSVCRKENHCGALQSGVRERQGAAVLFRGALLPEYGYKCRHRCGYSGYTSPDPPHPDRNFRPRWNRRASCKARSILSCRSAFR